MIGFRLQKGFLDISPSVQLSLTATTPFLDIDHIGRAYTFDFTADRTPQNDKLFSHLYRLDTTAEAINLPCRCYLQGYELQKGQLSVQEIEKGYKCYFQSENKLAADNLDKNISFFVSDTIQLFTDGPSDVDMEYLIWFVPPAGTETQTAQVKVRGELFTINIVYNTTTDSYDYEAAASDLAGAINAEFADIEASIFNTYTVKLLSTDSSLILIEPIEHTYSQQFFEQAHYEHQRIVTGIQALINDANAPVAFPPVYAPSVYTDNEAYQLYKILNNLESPVSFALSWVIFFVPPAGTETQTAQVKVRGELFTVNIEYSSVTSSYDYDSAAIALTTLLVIAFSDLTTTVFNTTTVKIESATGELVIIEPIEHCNSQPLNSYGSGFGKLRQNTVETTRKWNNSVVPMLKVAYVFKKIAEKLGFDIGGEVWDDAEFQKFIFFNTVTLDDLKSLNNNTQYINRFKKEIVLAQHLPDMSAKEFLAAFSEQFGFYYSVQNNKFLVRWKQDLISRPPQNWTELLEISNIRRVPFRKKGIKIKYQHDKEAPTTEYPAAFSSYSIGEGGEEYILPFDSPTIIEHNRQGYNRLPHWWGKTEQTPKMLLILRGGTFGNSSTLSYQFATNDDKNALGIAIPNAWTLAIQGDNGIYNRYLKNIVPYKEADEIRAQFKLTPTHIFDIQQGNFTRVFSLTPQGEFTAVIEQVNLKIQNNRIDSATVDFKKI